MNEIFRHFRPLEISARKELKPQRNGGISFLAVPDDKKSVYAFWLYICPMNAGFSAAAAVSRLRSIREDNIDPWGQIILDERPLINQLIEAAVLTDLPSDIDKMIENISHINRIQTEKFERVKKQIAKTIYAD